MTEQQIAELIAEQKRTNELLLALCKDVNDFADERRREAQLQRLMDECPPFGSCVKPEADEAPAPGLEVAVTTFSSFATGDATSFAIKRSRAVSLPAESALLNVHVPLELTPTEIQVLSDLLLSAATRNLPGAARQEL